MMNKTTTIRFSDTDKTLLKKLSERLGITQTAVIRQAIRALARKEGISTKRVEDEHS
jgi:predicted DNA-binding protein